MKRGYVRRHRPERKMTRPPPACARDGLGCLLDYSFMATAALSKLSTMFTGRITFFATAAPFTLAGENFHCSTADVTTANSSASTPGVTDVMDVGLPVVSTTNARVTCCPANRDSTTGETTEMGAGMSVRPR